MKNRIISLVWLMLLTANLFAGQVFYVTTSGSDSNDGKSWATAFADVQTAIDAAAEVATDVSPSEVWIAVGTYKHGSAMSMKNNVAIYGGFAGNETSKSERVFGNETILSGDKSYSVFYNKYTVSSPVEQASIDCVTIKDGYSLRGGGIRNEYSNITITNCQFIENIAYYSNGESWGGGIYCLTSNTELRNCLFYKNQSEKADGGAIYNDESSKMIIKNCTMDSNSATQNGSCISNLRGSDVQIINSTITNNVLNSISSSIGCIFNYQATGKIINSIIYGNILSNGNPNTIYNYSQSYKLSASDSIIQGGYSSGTNIIDEDPLLGELGYHGGFVKTIPVLEGSPAIKAGGSESLAIDARGCSRSIPCTIGAYEYKYIISIEPDKYNLSLNDVLNLKVSTELPVKEYSLWKNGVLISKQKENIFEIKESEIGIYQYSIGVIFEDGVNVCNSISVQFHHFAKRFFVSPTGSNSNGGISWDNAFASVQKAIDAAFASSSSEEIVQVWVAAGTYKEDTPIIMRNNVEIYGGFDGTETKIEDRKSENITILSGNGTHRVIVNYYSSSNPLTNSAKLDSVTITEGVASGESPENNGGGIYNYYASPVFSNCIITKNSARCGSISNCRSNPLFENCIVSENISSYGGGFHNYGASLPTIKNCEITLNKASYGAGIYNYNSSKPYIFNTKINSNIATYDGGGIYNTTEANMTLEKCIISENIAKNGGGIFNESSSPAIVNTVITKNKAQGLLHEGSGGGIYNHDSSGIQIVDCKITENNATIFGAGVYFDTSSGQIERCLIYANIMSVDNTAYTPTGAGIALNNSSSPNIINCTIASNKITGLNSYARGSGLSIKTNSDPSIINCTIVDNVNNKNYGNGAYIENSKPVIKNCILSGSIIGSPSITYSITDTEYDGVGNIGGDALLWELGDYGGKVQTIPILTGSPAIGAGIVDENTPKTDARGVIRSTTAPTIGAYEFAPPTIIETSKSVLGTINQDVSISISAKSALGDDNVAYKWQILNANGEWINIEGATESTYTIENCQLEMDGNKYRCIVSNILDGANVLSEEIVLTVVPSVSQAELSANRIMIVDGGYGRLEVSSDAFEPSYKWYYSANTGIDWVEIENSNSSVLEFKASSSMNRYQYKCVVTDGGGTSVESNKAVLIINSSAIVISQDIRDAMGFIGKETVLSVSATSSSSLGYQWQVSSDNGATWVDIKDATSSSLSLIPEDYELSGNLYRLKIDNGGGFIYSNVSTFTVFKNVEIREQPKDLIVWNAKNAEFEVSATGDGIIKYQWQILVGEEWRDIENAASAKFFLENVSTEMDGNKYRCAVSNEGTAVLYSNEATLTVYKTLEITSQPQEIWAFAGDSATFTVEVDAQGDVEYRWQEFIGGEWVDLENAALSEYQIPSMEDSFDGRKFRVLITNGGDVFASNEVSLKLATPVEITTQPQNIKLAYMGKMAVFSVEAVGYKPQYKWYVSGNYGTDEALEIDGATSNTLSISVDSDLVLENVYFCKITNDKSEKYSNLVYVEDIRTLSGYQSWAFDNGLDVDASVSAISHGDGITNLEKYAFGLDASKATSYGANGNFKHSVEGGVASFQFPVRKDASGISVKLMMSNDMSNWEEADAVSIGESGEFNLFNYSAPVPVNGKLFFKLKVLEK